MTVAYIGMIHLHPNSKDTHTSHHLISKSTHRLKCHAQQQLNRSGSSFKLWNAIILTAVRM